MDIIHKIPLILSAFMSIIVGMILAANNASSKEIYFKMLISIILFFFLGAFIKKTIIYAIKISKKNALEKEISLKNEKNIEKKQEEEGLIGSNVEYRVEGDDDEFLALNDLMKMDKKNTEDKGY